LLRAVGKVEGSEGIRLASVRLNSGPVVMVRLLADAAPGARVALAEESGAFVAQPDDNESRLVQAD
jgi:hypothetical protein